MVSGKDSYLLLGVGPARDLDNHVQNGLLVIGVKGDIVEGGDRNAILLDVYPVFQGVGLADFSRDEGHCGRLRGSRREVSGDQSGTTCEGRHLEINSRRRCGGEKRV